jgi:membrane metallo-endopeptidase-like protein 1
MIFKIVKGTVSMPTRSWVCANFVLDNMEYAVGRMYVSNYFNSESKKAATEMILNIQNEFKLNLKKVDWMDAESKKAALDKLDLIDIKIGYPEFTYNDTHMDNLYKDVSLSNFNFYIYS